MPSWPADLPQYVEPDQFEELPRLPAEEAPMDAGMPKSFLGGTDDGQVWRFTLPLDGAQRDSFDAFWRGDLRDGELTFDWVRPREQTPSRFAFTEHPSYQHLGGDDYRLTMVIQERADDRQMGFQAISASGGGFAISIGVTMGFAGEAGTIGDFD